MWMIATTYHKLGKVRSVPSFKTLWIRWYLLSGTFGHFPLKWYISCWRGIDLQSAKLQIIKFFEVQEESKLNILPSPGQLSVLQPSFSCRSPGQSAPPCRGKGLLQNRCLLLFPPSQPLSHSVHEDQSPQAPSRGISSAQTVLQWVWVATIIIIKVL